jgi:hypothetical protein
VHGVGTGPAASRHQRFDYQITLGGRSWANKYGFVRGHGVQGVAISIGIHRHGRYTQPPGRVNDPASNFAAVGYQDLLKHALIPWSMAEVRTPTRELSRELSPRRTRGWGNG